jgi:hypothetical protein
MKKNQKTTEKKLNLRKETLRPLNEKELAQAAGGACTQSSYLPQPDPTDD